MLGRLDAQRKQKLVDAQRAWLQSRDKDAVFEAALSGNTRVEHVAGGEYEMFRLCARADQLEHYLRLLD